MIDLIFWSLGLLGIVVAVCSCIAAGKSDREIEKIMKDNEKGGYK